MRNVPARLIAERKSHLLGNHSRLRSSSKPSSLAASKKVNGYRKVTISLPLKIEPNGSFLLTVRAGPCERRASDTLQAIGVLVIRNNSLI